MNKNKLPYYTVIVNEGSGCLFQPACEDYSYVLTAKHVLSDKNIITRQILNTDNHNVIPEEMEIIGSPFLHSDPNKDAAILKVKKVKDIDSLLRDDMLQYSSSNYYLCGHPMSRKDKNYSFRDNKLELTQVQEYGYIESNLNTPALRHEVIGQSGGGIIKIEASCFFLAGIQKKMAVADGKESLGRIEFAPLSFFDEIISENKKELEPLFPPYIKSFATLTNAIFELKSLHLKKDVIQNELRSIAKNLCEDFSPIKLREKLEDSFFVNSSNINLVEHKELWISFLELLSFSQLHSEKFLTMDDLIEVLSKRKLLFVDSDDWTKKLEEIYSSDLTPLEKGGTIVVKASREEVPAKLEYSPEELPLYDISIPPWQEMNIGSTIKDIFKDLKLVNIYKIQSYIINNAMIYSSATNSNVRELLKNHTQDVI